MTITTINDTYELYRRDVQNLKCRTKISDLASNHKLNSSSILDWFELNFISQHEDRDSFEVTEHSDLKGKFKSFKLKDDRINSTNHFKELFIQQTEFLRFYIETNTFIFYSTKGLRDELRSTKWGSKATAFETKDIPCHIKCDRGNSMLWELSDFNYPEEKNEFFKIIDTVIKQVIALNDIETQPF
jgi:hypothetical protein